MKTVKFMDWDCIVAYAKYQNGRLAIQLMDAEDGSPIATASVNLVDEVLADDEVAIKDYSENAGMLDVLVEAGIVSEPLRYAQSGWVTIPICTHLGISKALYGDDS